MNDISCSSFTFNACFAMDSMEGYLSDNNLELKYRIEAETFSGRKFSRVRFAHGLTEKPHVVERNIQLRGVRNGTEQCFEETAFVKVFLFVFLVFFFLKFIDPAAEVWLVERGKV